MSSIKVKQIYMYTMIICTDLYVHHIQIYIYIYLWAKTGRDEIYKNDNRIDRMV